MTLGEIIRARRKALDLTQAELADRSGLSQMSVSLFENDRRNPSLGTLDVLAVHLKCSTSDLLLAREEDQHGR